MIITRSMMTFLVPILATIASSAWAERVERAGTPREIDLTDLVICHSPNPRQGQAAAFLRDEIERRSHVAVPTAVSEPSDKAPAIFMGRADSFPVTYDLPDHLAVPEGAEGFALWVDTTRRAAPTIYIVGRDDRGVLFGAGMLIRKLNIEPKTITLNRTLKVATAPQYSIRGHKLLPREHDFIDWNDRANRAQLVKDLALFGTNSFDLNRYRDSADEKLSETLEELGLDFWVTLGGGRVMDVKSLEDVRNEFGRLTGLDAVAIPGGDSSGTPEHRVLLPAIAQFGPLFKQAFPSATVWFSNQCGKDHAQEDNDYIFAFLRDNRPSWLEGMTYGPWTKMDIPELRRRLPAPYKIWLKPDICHNLGCMYPIPKWDCALARAWGRDGISAMPRMMATIHNATAEGTEGFIAYNHTGVVNDLNKFVWSALAWDPRSDLEEILRDYGRAFFGSKYADDVAKGLLLLEDNWAGALRQNDAPVRALRLWKRLAEQMGGPEAVAGNWRLELYLTKAFIDAQVKRKYDAEWENEHLAYQALRRADSIGADRAIQEARKALASIDDNFQSKEDFLREMRSWGLRRYGDLDEILDNLYHALNDRQWLESEFKAILELTDEGAHLKRIRDIVNWEDAGPGGFYDNLGVPGKQPHLVRGKPWEEDPGFDHSPIEFHMHKPSSKLRQSMLVSAVTRYSNPIVMRYEGLDPEATYRMQVIYNGPWAPEMMCETDDGYLIHGPRGNTGGERAEYHIPPEATRDGRLELNWRLTNVVRGPSLTEIWLIKNNNANVKR